MISFSCTMLILHNAHCQISNISQMGLAILADLIYSKKVHILTILHHQFFINKCRYISEPPSRLAAHTAEFSHLISRCSYLEGQLSAELHSRQSFRISISFFHVSFGIPKDCQTVGSVKLDVLSGLI